MRQRFWLISLVSLTCLLLQDGVLVAAQKGKAARSKVNPEAAIAAAIQTLGGAVEHADQDPKQPIIAVVLANTKVTPAILKSLTELRSLTTVILHNTKVDDAGLAILATIPTLEAIDLDNTLVTDAGLNALKGLPALQELYLTGTGTTEKAIVALRKKLPNAEIVWLPPLPKLATAEAYFKLADELVLKGERVQGIRAYTAALQIDPKHLNSIHSRAWALLKQDEPQAARTDFEQFVKLQPDNSLSYAGLALSLYLTGEPEKAVAAAEKALKLDKNCSDAFYVRGMVTFDRKEYEAALPDFEKAAELEPKDAANHERLGWTYYELKFYENALTSFDEAIRLDKDFEHAFYGRGLYWMAMKKPVRAVEDFSKAWQLDPTFPDYAVDLALAQASLGDFKAAVATQSKVLEIAAEEDRPAQELRLKAYQAKRLPVKSLAGGQPAVESAAKPAAGKR